MKFINWFAFKTSSSYSTQSINSFRILRVSSTTYQLLEIKGIEIGFKASGDPRSKLWHVLSRLLIATTPYHSQLSGTKGADHLEITWDEDVLWVKVAWIFSGIAYCLQTRLYSRRFESIIYDRNKGKPQTCLCIQLYLALYILNNL